MFSAATFTAGKSWKQHKYPWTQKLIKNRLYKFFIFSHKEELSHSFLKKGIDLWIIILRVQNHSWKNKYRISSSLCFLGFIWICKRIYVCSTQRFKHDYLGTQSRLRKGSQRGRVGGLENIVCLCMVKRNDKK